MKSFSLEKLKNRVGRRFSDPSDFDNTGLAADHRRSSLSNSINFGPESDLPRASSSLSIHSDWTHRPRSTSVSKKQAKELIRHETSQVVKKKLLPILKDLGLQLPIPLKTSGGLLGGLLAKSMNIYVANTHNCIYLAPSLSTSFTYEDDENGGNIIPELESNTDLQELMDDDQNTPRLSVSSEAVPPPDVSTAIMNTISRKIRALKSANYLRTRIDSQTPIPHLFAVIIELQHDTLSKFVEVEFLTVSKTQWPTNDSANRHQCEEKFRIGHLAWDLSFQDADLFINTKNSKDTRLKDIDPQHLAERTREFRLFDARKTSSDSFEESLSSNHSRQSSDILSLSGLEVPADQQEAGLYVFLLPILLPPNIPATVNTANSSLTHKLSVRVPGPHERLTKKTAVKADYNLPMVRTPPSLANSIADKPICVNRTWNDSLHYSITFPRKYVALGSEHTINVKLVPVAKDVTVKRIKFNILERVIFVSKDLSKEYEFDGDDPFARAKNSKNRERVIPLCELRTKSKTNHGGLEPLKEEVLNCPDNNLLFSCYEKRPSSAAGSTSKDKTVMVASPLDINIALPFLTSKADKEVLSSSLNESDPDIGSPNPIAIPRKHSLTPRDLIASLESPSLPIIGSLETHISHLNENHLFRDGVDEDVLKLDSSSLLPKKHGGRSESIARGYTSTAKALSPDSNFRHIQISHRLQVSFRISKPDASDNNKMHHYEVVVDTPIILMSAKCNEGSMQLPEYDEVRTEPLSLRPGAVNFRTPSYIGNGVTIKPFNPSESDPLPSFEEATSAPSSPILRSTSMTSLDPSTPSNPPAYENVSYNSFDPSQDALTIDDVLVENSRSPSQRKHSAIRASLHNSFAPSPSTTSGSSSNIDVSPTPSFNSEENVPSSDDMSSQSTRSGVQTPISNDGGNELVEESTNATNSTSFMEDAGSIDADIESIVTEESPFVQRLPLLRNESTNGVETLMNGVSINNGGDFTSNDWSKMLTDTLNEESHAQSLFHAY